MLTSSLILSTSKVEWNFLHLSFSQHGLRKREQRFLLGLLGYSREETGQGWGRRHLPCCEDTQAVQWGCLCGQELRPPVTSHKWVSHLENKSSGGSELRWLPGCVREPPKALPDSAHEVNNGSSVTRLLLATCYKQQMINRLSFE